MRTFREVMVRLDNHSDFETYAAIYRGLSVNIV